MSTYKLLCFVPQLKGNNLARSDTTLRVQKEYRIMLACRHSLRKIHCRSAVSHSLHWSLYHFLKSKLLPATIFDSFVCPSALVISRNNTHNFLKPTLIHFVIFTCARTVNSLYPINYLALDNSNTLCSTKGYISFVYPPWQRSHRVTLVFEKHHSTHQINLRLLMPKQKTNSTATQL